MDCTEIYNELDRLRGDFEYVSIDEIKMYIVIMLQTKHITKWEGTTYGFKHTIERAYGKYCSNNDVKCVLCEFGFKLGLLPCWGDKVKWVNDYSKGRYSAINKTMKEYILSDSTNLYFKEERSTRRRINEVMNRNIL